MAVGILHVSLWYVVRSYFLMTYVSWPFPPSISPFFDSSGLEFLPLLVLVRRSLRPLDRAQPTQMIAFTYRERRSWRRWWYIHIYYVRLVADGRKYIHVKQVQKASKAKWLVIVSRSHAWKGILKVIKCWIILQKQQRKQEKDSNESKQVTLTALSLLWR